MWSVRTSRDVVVLIVLMTVAAASGAWLPKTYPNPKVEPGRCDRPGFSTYICDPNAILHEAERNRVQSILKKIHAADPPFTTSHCLAEPFKGSRASLAAGLQFGYQVCPPLSFKAYVALSLGHRSCLAIILETSYLLFVVPSLHSAKIRSRIFQCGDQEHCRDWKT